MVGGHVARDYFINQDRPCYAGIILLCFNFQPVIKSISKRKRCKEKCLEN